MKKEHIAICICTFKRPGYLQRLLAELVRQETGGLFTFSIVVADNDHLQSARTVVSEQRARTSVPIVYCVETEQNIALARNKALQHASGDYIGFIDDDEFPAKNWLVTLFETRAKCKVDGVLGPVKPYFEQAPPRWIVRGGFYDRPTHNTGFIIPWTEGRTGNLLFQRSILNGTDQAFRPEFGSGGEDRDFFRRMIARGHVFAWSNEAVVYEVVPAVRWKRLFMLKRALLRGKVSLVDQTSNKTKVAKSAIAIPAYVLALPFFLIMGQHRFMKYLIKIFDHLGRILAFLGMDPIKEKYVTE